MAEGVLPCSQDGIRFEIPNGIVLEPGRKMLRRCFHAFPGTTGSYIAARHKVQRKRLSWKILISPCMQVHINRPSVRRALLKSSPVDAYLDCLLRLFV